MGAFLSELGFIGLILVGLGGIVLLFVEALVCIGFGLLAERCPAGVRFVLWPIGLALIIGFLPGLLLAAIFLGFMRPPFSGHTVPRSKRSRPQKGLNGLFELMSAPWLVPQPD